MYGPSKEAWNFLVFLIVMGVILCIAIWLLGPPALIASVAWLAAPRMGWTDINYIEMYAGVTAVWLLLNAAFLVLAAWPWTLLDFKRK